MSESYLLSDTTAVVTGAASGNGRAIATRFAEEGADVIVADIQSEDRLGGTPTHEKIEAETDSRAKYVSCDVTNADDLKQAIATADEFGGLDIMVNNAGINGPQKPVTEVSREEYENILDVNLSGVLFGAQQAALAMLEQETNGAIINMTSSAGIRGGPRGSLYAMSKAGVRVLTQSLAAELAPEGIRVNAIAPGTIETAFTIEDAELVGTEFGEQMKQAIPMGRFGEPEEVANAAVFLASDLANYVTAHTLTVDGGMMETF